MGCVPMLAGVARMCGIMMFGQYFPHIPGDILGVYMVALLGAAFLVALGRGPAPRCDGRTTILGAAFLMGLALGTLVSAPAVLAGAVVALCAIPFILGKRRPAVPMPGVGLASPEDVQLAGTVAEPEAGRRHLDAVLDNMIQGVCLFDAAGRLVIWNRRYNEIYDLRPEATRVGKSLAEIVLERDAAGSGPDMSSEEYLDWRAQVVAAGLIADSTVHLKNGRVVTIHHRPLPDGGWVATHADVTEQHRAQASILFMARHDALTRLPNRVLFQERLEHALEAARRGQGCALLCLDLDRFKTVNDTLGHPAGDILLCAVAERLSACVREVDTVARLGGDEFAVILFGVDRPQDAATLAERIVTAFRQPFTVQAHQVSIGTSIGVAMTARGDVVSETLLRNADTALCLAKLEAKGTIRFFEADMDVQIQARRTLEFDLLEALARDELEILYQPSVDLVGQKVVAFEALLRWRHRVHGILPPLEFIPLAEETGTIISIGAWVLETACRQAQEWPSGIRVAVNLSPLQFRSGDIVAAVRSVLASSGLTPERLEIEITESVILQNSESTLAALHAVRGLGVSVALDDFGTGYASMSYLRRFPFDRIKIDRSFVRDLPGSPDSAAIVRAVIRLAHSLDMQTTAEGVENMEQLDQLGLEGCTEAQGFLFSRPKPASELAAVIELFETGGWLRRSGIVPADSWGGSAGSAVWQQTEPLALVEPCLPMADVPGSNGITTASPECQR